MQLRSPSWMSDKKQDRLPVILLTLIREYFIVVWG